MNENREHSRRWVRIVQCSWLRFPFTGCGASPVSQDIQRMYPLRSVPNGDLDTTTRKTILDDMCTCSKLGIRMLWR
jgi:hypothetical protein